jgi:hypothetical protein
MVSRELPTVMMIALAVAVAVLGTERPILQTISHRIMM